MLFFGVTSVLLSCFLSLRLRCIRSKFRRNLLPILLSSHLAFLPCLSPLPFSLAFSPCLPLPSSLPSNITTSERHNPTNTLQSIPQPQPPPHPHPMPPNLSLLLLPRPPSRRLLRSRRSPNRILRWRGFDAFLLEFLDVDTGMLSPPTLSPPPSRLPSQSPLRPEGHKKFPGWGGWRSWSKGLTKSGRFPNSHPRRLRKPTLWHMG